MVEAEAALAAIKAIQIPLKLLTFLHLTGTLWPTEPVVKNNTCCDYVIVGGGTAGMVVASRMSENPDINVCVLEAGGNPPIEALLPPLFVAEPLSELDWNFTSTYNPYSASSQTGNVTKLTSGKMLGGSSCMDHFIHVRAAPHTFNTWADIVNDPTWNYDNVLPYFKKSEHLKDSVIENSRYGKYHGLGGPMGVARQPSLAANPYLVSFGEMGNRVVFDINAYDTRGFTQSMYILTDGVRQCSAFSYIHPVKDRRNLFVFRHTYVTRIKFDENKTAIAVEAVKDGKKFIVKASREIILCAGVYKTAQILMLSGVGPNKHLKDFNIKIIADLPVGDNWQEQVTVALVHKTDKSPVDPLVPLPTKIPFPVLVGLVSLKENQSYADYQVFGIIVGAATPYLVLALTVVFGYKPAITDVIQNKVIGHNSIIGLLGLLDPESKGHVRLKTANPFDDPEITTNFLKNKKDTKKMISYIKDYTRIENSTFFTQVNASFVDPELPKCKKYKFRSDKYWECYVLHMAISVYHPVGTCAMGTVVDGGLRVHGVKNLRIGDASVIPDTPRGSPHALVIMIAEKVSDMMKADAFKFPSCKDLKNGGCDVELPEINTTAEEKLPTPTL